MSLTPLSLGPAWFRSLPRHARTIGFSCPLVSFWSLHHDARLMSILLCHSFAQTLGGAPQVTEDTIQFPRLIQKILNICSCPCSPKYSIFTCFMVISYHILERVSSPSWLLYAHILLILKSLLKYILVQSVHILAFVNCSGPSLFIGN